jgi:hypothetical protein
MRISLLLLLLLPGLTLAQSDKKLGGNLTIKAAETAEQPAETIWRVSKSSPNTMIFQDKASWDGLTKDTVWTAIISPGDPLCWDSAGKMVKIDLSERAAKTKGYQKAVKIAGSFIEYDSIGNIRYEKGGQTLGIKPAFTGVKMEFAPQATQMKAIYYIDKDITLAWKLTDPHHMAARKLPAFTARDAAGKPVELVETRTDTSLSVALKSTEGVIWPVAIDPTVQDTVFNTKSGSIEAYSLATFSENRDATNATAGSEQMWTTGKTLRSGTNGAGGKWVTRTYLTFTMPTITATTIDSARFFVRVAGWGQTYDSLSVFGAWGLWSGNLSTTWFSQFQGRVAGGAHTSVNPLASLIHVSLLTSADSLAWKSALFTAAALDTIKDKSDGAGDDTLRFALIGRPDMYNSCITAQQAGWYAESLPYIVIYYRTGTTPFVSTLADSARASAILVGQIDSTGGVNCTARGFQWWIDGDTTTLTKSGTFTAGTYVDTVKVLPVSVTVSFRSFATNTNGTTYGSVKTFSTSGSMLKVMGRTVNTNVR